MNQPTKVTNKLRTSIIIETFSRKFFLVISSLFILFMFYITYTGKDFKPYDHLIYI